MRNFPSGKSMPTYKKQLQRMPIYSRLDLDTNANTCCFDKKNIFYKFNTPPPPFLQFSCFLQVLDVLNGHADLFYFKKRLGYGFSLFKRESDSRFSTSDFFMNQFLPAPEYLRAISNCLQKSRRYTSIFVNHR